ncbi:MAG: hypothetical protein WDO19_25050 [Bacteroidota bacterium]
MNRGAKTKVETLLEPYKFREALYEVIDLSRKGNQYMQKKEPWIVAKTTSSNSSEGGVQTPNDWQHKKTLLIPMHLCLQLTANLAILINPFLPNTAKKCCT